MTRTEFRQFVVATFNAMDMITPAEGSTAVLKAFDEVEAALAALPTIHTCEGSAPCAECDRLAALAGPAETKAADQRGWLIEKHINSRLHFWTARVSDPKNGWTLKHEDATRFAREEDAAVVLSWLCGGDGRTVEHLWTWALAGPQEPTPPDDEGLHTGDDERIDLVSSIIASAQEIEGNEELTDIAASIIDDCHKLDALLLNTIKQERALTGGAAPHWQSVYESCQCPAKPGEPCPFSETECVRRVKKALAVPYIERAATLSGCSWKCSAKYVSDGFDACCSTCQSIALAMVDAMIDGRSMSLGFPAAPATKDQTP